MVAGWPCGRLRGVACCEDRIDRPSQTHLVFITDLMATALRREDVQAWAAAQDIKTIRADDAVV